MSRLISIYNLPPSLERGMRAVQVVLTDGDRAHGCTLYRAVRRREPSVEASPTSYDVTVKSTHALRDEAYAALCARLEANGWQKLALDELDDFAEGVLLDALTFARVRGYVDKASFYLAFGDRDGEPRLAIQYNEREGSMVRWERKEGHLRRQGGLFGLDGRPRLAEIVRWLVPAVSGLQEVAE